jgi:Cys-rich repeat protein
MNTWLDCRLLGTVAVLIFLTGAQSEDGCFGGASDEERPPVCEEIGEAFPAGDGCNTCFCGDDGQVRCTLVVCPGCQSDDECGRGHTCDLDGCPGVVCGQTCVIDADSCDGYGICDMEPSPCATGNLLHVVANGCFTGECTSAAARTCVPNAECLADEDCAEGWVCEGELVCGPDADCSIATQAGWCAVLVDRECAFDTDCADGDSCVVECVMCPEPDPAEEFFQGCDPACWGRCEPRPDGCAYDSDCGLGSHCEGSSVCPPDVTCTWEGEPGVCAPDVYCVEDSDCDAAEHCTFGDGTCYIACYDGWCGDACTGVCKPGDRGCFSDADCPSGTVCDGESVCPEGAACFVADAAGVCGEPTPEPVACDGNNDCSPSERCLGGVCVPKAN